MSVADVERYAYNVSNSYLSREVITFDGKSRIYNEEARQRKNRIANGLRGHSRRK